MQAGLTKLKENAPFELRSAWLAGTETAMSETNASATLPLLGPFGYPPPLIKVGFNFTDLASPESFDLPTSLYEYSIGLVYIRQWNDRWTVISMLGAGMATDNENRSSEAWRFRGGILGVYKRSESWQWTLGAVATGREDLPIVPAVGAIWNVNERTRVDLTFPRPRYYRLVFEQGAIQHWAYLGASINGSTWAYERSGEVDDLLTYRDWRFALGWESHLADNPALSFTRRKKLSGEIGLAFAREFEFENESRTEVLDNSLFLSIMAKF